MRKSSTQTGKKSEEASGKVREEKRADAAEL